MFRYMLRIIIGIVVVYSIVSTGYASFSASVIVGNVAPEIISVKTFSSYVDDSNNVPETSFTYPDKRTVYIQVKARDYNKYQDIQENGSVKIKIVLWNGSAETEFTRFGSSYLNASFESGSGTDVIYTYTFQMSDSDSDRTAPHYYRVKTQVSDAEFNVTSNISDEQNADYTYEVTTSPPPELVLFDITIDIPEDNRVMEPGESFYAAVAITKISPPGVRDIQIEYRIVDPDGTAVDSFTETVAVNDTIYRVPVLYIPLNATPGTYRFRASVAYGGVLVWSEALFTVQASGPTTTTTIPSTSTTTVASTSTTTTTAPGATTTTTIKRKHGTHRDRDIPTTITPPVVMKREIFIYRHPQEIHAFKGESKPVLVIVENIGDLVLNGVTVYIGGPDVIDKIVPGKIDDVEPGSRRIFIIEIKIPSDMAAGEYDLVLKAIATHATDERHIRLVVLEKPSEPDKLLGRQMDELKELVGDIWIETAQRGLEGKNVSQVFKSLDSAKDSISKAKEYWRNKEYDKTRDAIKDVKRHIEEAIIKLAMKPEKEVEIKEIFSTKEVTLYVLPPGYWIFAIIALLSVVLLIYNRYKVKITGAVLKEKYEFLRVKDQILKHR